MRADFERGLALGLAMGGLSVGEVKEIPAPEPEPVVQMIFHQTFAKCWQGYIGARPIYASNQAQGYVLNDSFYGEKIEIEVKEE